MTSLESIAFGAAGTTVAAPLLGAGVLAVAGDRSVPRLVAGAALATVLAAAAVVAAAWYGAGGAALAVGHRLVGGSFLTVDGLTALLMPFIAAVDLAILVAAPRRALEPQAVARMLLGVATTFAMLATAHPALLVVLWVASAASTWSAVRRTLGAVGGWLVALAVMMRKGLVPFHSWYPALYTGGPLAAALTATIPQVASYTAIRLLLGHADGVGPELVFLANAALVTAAYGAALAVVQRDARGLVGHLAMSQSARVLAGITATEPMELVGALAVWVSSGLSLTGISLVIWALESRGGRISIDTLQGRFADAPALAVFFLLFGLASLGFPGTLSFVADDLIISGALGAQTHAGVLVILTTVFAGIAVLRGWFRIFGGPVTSDAPRHEILPRERFVFAALLAILVGLGLWPGPFVHSLDVVAHSILPVPHDAAVHQPAGVPP